MYREKGISEATFYASRMKVNGTSTKEVQKLRELEKENARLKKLLAERDLENNVLKEALARHAAMCLERHVQTTLLSNLFWWST